MVWLVCSVLSSFVLQRLSSSEGGRQHRRRGGGAGGIMRSMRMPILHPTPHRSTPLSPALSSLNRLRCWPLAFLHALSPLPCLPFLLLGIHLASARSRNLIPLNRFIYLALLLHDRIIPLSSSISLCIRFKKYPFCTMPGEVTLLRRPSF